MLMEQIRSDEMYKASVRQGQTDEGANFHQNLVRTSRTPRPQANPAFFIRPEMAVAWSMKHGAHPCADHFCSSLLACPPCGWSAGPRGGASQGRARQDDHGPRGPRRQRAVPLRDAQHRHRQDPSAIRMRRRWCLVYCVTVVLCKRNINTNAFEVHECRPFVSTSGTSPRCATSTSARSFGDKAADGCYDGALRVVCFVL
jgi:hypothetical protein